MAAYGPLSGRLYLPAAWLEDPARQAAGKIPAGVLHLTKNELALELVLRLVGRCPWCLTRFNDST